MQGNSIWGTLSNLLEFINMVAVEAVLDDSTTLPTDLWVLCSSRTHVSP